MNRRLLSLVPALLLSLPVARAQDDLYRIRGRGEVDGPFTGLVRVDPASNRLDTEVHYADGVDDDLAGLGRRAGTDLVLDLNPIALTSALPGGAPSPRTLVLRFGGSLVAGRVLGAPRIALSGERLVFALEANLQPAARLAAYQATARQGSFVGAGGLNIHYACFDAPNERGVVVIVPGRTEFGEKYAEVVGDLVRLGYSVDVIDNRGHGHSDHLLGNASPGSDERDKCHVERFQDYVDDLHTFVGQVVRATSHRRLFLLGHSMGGAICTRFAEEFPADADAVVLSSPMHGIPVSFWQRRYVDLQVLIGHGASYAKDKGPYTANDPFAGNDVTHSQARFDYEGVAIAADPLLRVGGPTYRWVRESFRATKPMRDDAPHITAPVLLLQAAEDTVVVNSDEDAVVARIPHVTKVVMPGARHEILQESDAIRREALARIVVFLDRHSQ